MGFRRPKFDESQVQRACDGKFAEKPAGEVPEGAAADLRRLAETEALAPLNEDNSALVAARSAEEARANARFGPNFAAAGRVEEAHGYGVDGTSTDAFGGGTLWRVEGVEMPEGPCCVNLSDGVDHHSSCPITGTPHDPVRPGARTMVRSTGGPRQTCTSCLASTTTYVTVMMDKESDFEGPGGSVRRFHYCETPQCAARAHTLALGEAPEAW